METIWQWGLDFIYTVQSVRSPALDAFFKAVEFTGDEKFFLILLPLIYWCVDSAIGARLFIAFLISSYVNFGLKDLIAHPRPFEHDPSVKVIEPASTYGLPSGHSQLAIVVWGIIAGEFRRKWLWVTAILLIVLGSLSTIYLGGHFPTDVLGGWAVGAALLAVYLVCGPRVEAWLKRKGLAMQLALAVVVPLALLLLHLTDSTITAMAVLLGTGVGVTLTSQVAPFTTTGPVWQRAVRFLVGALPMLVLYFGLKLVFPDEGESLYATLRFVRYALVGLWVGLGAPWLFRRLRLVSTA